MGQEIGKSLKKATRYFDAGRLDQAERQCLRILKQRPGHIPTLGLLGRTHYAQRRFDEAAAAYLKVLEALPDDHETRVHLIHCYRDNGNFEDMLKLADYFERDTNHPESQLIAFRSYLHACDWERAERLRERVLTQLENNVIPLPYLAGSLLDLNALPGLETEHIFRIHKLWGDQIIQQTERLRLPLRPASPPNERIRIGYLSADFNKHPVGNLIKPVLANHDRERFEIFCYAYLHKQDEMTDEIRAVAEHFVDVTHMKHDEIATRINQDGIHILVDLGGHTTASQLPVLAFRPAPVQITWLGYPNTTGLSTVDYRITDRHADLQEGGTIYVEELLFMPDSFLTLDGLPTVPMCKETPAIDNGYITFGSFNNIRKLNPAVIHTWSRILNAVPNSRLLIKSPGCESAIVRTNILNEFGRHHVNRDAIEFAEYTHSYEEHAAQYNRVDIALDPFPYHGTHTTCEALWMGVPVITLEGNAHVQRVSSSILRNIGYDATITSTEDEYVAKAVELASIPENLGLVRRCITALIRHSVICRPQEFTENLERLYIEACEKQQIPIPEHLHLPAPSAPKPAPSDVQAPQALIICDRLEPLTWHAIRSHCHAVLSGESDAWLTLLVPPGEEQQRILRNLAVFLQLHYDNQPDKVHIRLVAAETDENMLQHITSHNFLCLPEATSSTTWQVWMDTAQRNNVELLPLNAEAVRASQATVAPLPPLSDDSVTIVIPTYNRLNLLKRAVASALEQKHENLRLIIADNASTDGTKEWCEALAQHDPRVRYVRHDQNLGAAENHRLGYEMVETSLFVFCGDDDVLTPSHLQRTVAMFKRYPGLGMAYGQSNIVDIHGKVLSCLDFTNTVDGIVDPRHELLESFLRNQIIWNSALVRKDAVKRLLHGDDTRLASLMQRAIKGDDYLFGVLLLATAPAAYVNEVTAHFTINPDAVSATLLDGGLELEIGVLEELPALYEQRFGSMDEDAVRAMATGLKLREERLQNVQNQPAPSSSNERRQWKKRIREAFRRIDDLRAMLDSPVSPPSTSQALDMKEWSHQVQLTIQRLHNASEHDEACTQLRALRAMFVQAWLTHGQWDEKTFDTAKSGCRELLFCGLRYEPLVEDERMLVRALREQLAESGDMAANPSVLLAAMLYCQPHELPVCRTPDQLPGPLLELYLDFVHTIPELFFRPGEAEQYRRFMEAWVDIIHMHTAERRISGTWKHIAEHFALKANFIPVYMTDRNLRDVFIKRADIITSFLASQGNQLDWSPAPRDNGNKRIRLGIMANHFMPQTETFAALPFFEHLDRQQFEVVLIAFQATDHPLEQYCRKHADAFVHVRGNAVCDWVEQIRALDLDMLLLASNVTAVGNHSALTAPHRLARIQMASVASCVTTGMKHMDYYISGEYTETDHHAQDDYREKLVMLPGPAHCYHFPEEEDAGRTIRRTELGVPDDAVLYISGANYYKITPEVEETWARIIAETPRAWLLLYPFNPNWSNTYATQPFIRRLKNAFERHDIPPERLVIVPPRERRADIKTMLALADVYLDAFPFSGVTSLLDPLEAAIPPVVMQGRHFRSRMAEACLRDIQMSELTCQDTVHYIETAIRLGQDKAWREQMRTRIADAMSAPPRFLNPQAYGQACSQLLRDIAQQHGLATPSVTEQSTIRDERNAPVPERA